MTMAPVPLSIILFDVFVGILVGWYYGNKTQPGRWYYWPALVVAVSVMFDMKIGDGARLIADLARDVLILSVMIAVYGMFKDSEDQGKK